VLWDVGKKGLNMRRARRADPSATEQSKDRAAAKWVADEGQSLVEMTVGIAFLLGILLILFEMTMLFRSYIILLNAAREGAVYASAHPTMVSGTPEYDTYEFVTRGEALAAGLNVDAEFFEILPPVPSGPIQPGAGIRVTLRYKLINPTEGIVLPFFDRMGLWRTTWIQASVEMPIR
jgi:hypothetical protein